MSSSFSSTSSSASWPNNHKVVPIASNGVAVASPPTISAPFRAFGSEKSPDRQKSKGGDVILKRGTDRELVRDGGLSYPATLLNFLKSLVGAGFLSLPLAFRDAGLWTAAILLVIFAVLNCFCMMQLVKCAQHHYKRLNIPYLNYGNVARETCSVSFRWIRPYGNVAKAIVNLSVLLLQFGFCSTYYLFIAVSLKEIFDELTTYHHSTMHWLMLIYIPMVLLNFFRTLRLLAFFSALGNVLMMSSLVFTLYYLVANPRYAIGDLPFFNSFDGLLTASGAIIYSFEAQTLVLPIENKLKRPQQMLGPFGILSTGIFFSSLIYGSMGFFGYVAYGQEVKGSITLNLPQHHVSFTLVKLALCLSIFASFLLQMYVIVEMLWFWLARMIIEEKENEEGEGKPKKEAAEHRGRWWRLPASFKLGCELLLRVLMVTVCFTFAAAVPNLERIIPLVGITAGMLLSFVFPALLDLLTFVPIFLQRRQLCWARLRLAQNLLLAGVGLFGLVAGLRANIRAMVGGAGQEQHQLDNSTSHAGLANATGEAVQNLIGTMAGTANNSMAFR